MAGKHDLPESGIHFSGVSEHLIISMSNGLVKTFINMLNLVETEDTGSSFNVSFKMKALGRMWFA